jgi:hypothetical protein
MGCCASKPLEFAPLSLGDGILPSPPNNVSSSFEAVKLIPPQGLVARAFAVYLSKDQDKCPSYYFTNSADVVLNKATFDPATKELLLSDDLLKIVYNTKRSIIKRTGKDYGDVDENGFQILRDTFEIQYRHVDIITKGE